MADRRVDNADWLLTLDRERRVVRVGAVAITRGRIAAVGKTADVAAAHPAPRVISARGKVVTPGLIDSHIHTTFQACSGSTSAGRPSGRSSYCASVASRSWRRRGGLCSERRPADRPQ